MHGQTVYITKINNASWAKKKYHIAKDRNATHPLGWVDLSQISGYEKGIKSVPKDEMAVVGEHKKPETIVFDDGSIFNSAIRIHLCLITMLMKTYGVLQMIHKDSLKA